LIKYFPLTKTPRDLNAEQLSKENIVKSGKIKVKIV